MKIEDGVMSMPRGDSEAFYVSHKKDGVPTNFITGDVVYFTVKKNTSDETKVLQKKIMTFIEGKALVEIMPADTNQLESTEYVFDIQINFASGLVKTVMGPAPFVLGPEVTYE